ncbi:MAG: hypothetical protein WBP72_13300 [Rhodocyclaceae bacterium]
MRLVPIVLSLVLSLPLAARAVDAEPGDLDEHTLAKMAKARAKAGNQGHQKDKDAASLIEEDPGNGSKGLSSCGVNIGNSVNSRPGQAPKEIVVVVKGDFINANNRCK